MIIWKSIMLILKVFLKPDNFFDLDGIDLFLDLKVLQKILPKEKKIATNILNFMKELNFSKYIYCIYNIINYTCHSCIRWKKFFKVKTRGGQKTVKPDPPDQSGRPARPPARPLAYIRTDTDTDILNIRITDG